MVQNIISSQANKAQQPKRDPILQNNGEAPGVFLLSPPFLNSLLSIKDL